MENNIKIIALDLDGTTIDARAEISKENKEAIEYAIEKGVFVVPATGRNFTSIPDSIANIEGIKYAITSNGGELRTFPKGEILYRSTILPKVVDEVRKILLEKKTMFEVFAGGRGYIDERDYHLIMDGKVSYRDRTYVAATRIPVKDIYETLEKEKENIENLNIFFSDYKEKIMMMDVFSKIDKATVTTSFRENIEIGGENTSKGTALGELCKILNIESEDVLACGDNLNDLEMIRFAGVGIAMSNGLSELKEESDYIFNNEKHKGVSRVVDRFIK